MEVCGYKVAVGITYHPWTNGQTEWVNQMSEDMLRTCNISHEASVSANYYFIKMR